MENLIEKQNVCVGLLWMGDDKHSVKIDVDEKGQFINSEQELKDWAFALNNPWSDISTHYVVSPNFHFLGEWVAERTVIVYDSVEAHITAAGDSPQQAITNCNEFMKVVIEKYCVDDEDDN